MQGGFDRANFDALAELWNAFFGPLYEINGEQLRFHTVDSHLFDWGASIIEYEGERPIAFVAVKKSAAPLYRGPDPDQAHITGLAFRSPTAMVDLLSYTKKLLSNRGVYKLFFGQDSRHFFPGCPLDCSALCNFLMVEGFEAIGASSDLERSLQDFEPANAWKSTLNDSGAEVRPVAEQDVEKLRHFLEKEFPGRWRYDTMAKIADEERSDFVDALWIGDRLSGFSVTQDSSHRCPIGGGSWRMSLGEHWGAIGPIGVAASARGKGLGEALLTSSLVRMKDAGIRRCIIDWTAIESFYEKFGFEPTRRYEGYALTLHP